MVTNYIEKATKLRQLRIAKGITIDELAAAIHISVYSAQKYESGWRVPNDDIKRKISKFYDVSVEELFYSS